MRKILFFFTLLIGSTVLHAQLVEQGVHELYNQRYESAENTFHAALQQDSNNAEAWYWLTKGYLQQDELQQAKDSLSKAPPAIQNRPLYKIALGLVLLQEGNNHNAAPYFNDALNETKHKDPAVLAAVAQAHIDAKAGNAKYAIELLGKAIRKGKKNANLYLLLGNAYRKLNNGSKAFEAYKEALDKNNQLAAAHYQLGKIFVTQKNPDVYLEHFNKAIAVDKNYAPAYYELYRHYFYTDPVKAMQYFKQYEAFSDKTIENDYAYTDLLYLNKDYEKAIQHANRLIATATTDVHPRLYKLLAYSYAGTKDTAKAINYMHQYFSYEADSNWVVKDFEAVGDWYAATEGKMDSALIYYGQAAEREEDPKAAFVYYKKLASLAQSLDNHSAHANWLGKYYKNNKEATNVDLFNWGLAHYRAGEYTQADSVFGLYVKEYPEQGFGHYWRARSNAVLDKEMAEGLAVPHYLKLVEVMQKDTTNDNYKKWIVEAYGYLAAYETNEQKNYAAAIDYFRKLLTVDPENADAEKYIDMLEKKLVKDNK